MQIRQVETDLRTLLTDVARTVAENTVLAEMLSAALETEVRANHLGSFRNARRPLLALRAFRSRAARPRSRVGSLSVRHGCVSVR